MAFIRARRERDLSSPSQSTDAGQDDSANEGEITMTISKYRVRSTCLSCGRRVKGSVVAVVTTVKEDEHEPRAY